MDPHFEPCVVEERGWGVVEREAGQREFRASGRFKNEARLEVEGQLARAHALKFKG